MTFTFEQLLPPRHLRVIPVLDLEPRRPFVFGDIVPKAVLRYNPLQVHSTDPFEQRRPALLYMFDVPHSRLRDLG
jgi:hypothetical protein